MKKVPKARGSDVNWSNLYFQIRIDVPGAGYVRLYVLGIKKASLTRSNRG